MQVGCGRWACPNPGIRGQEGTKLGREVGWGKLARNS